MSTIVDQVVVFNRMFFLQLDPIAGILVAFSNERVGTIHTVQGREAEAVIFVSGAPNADQVGARGWAKREPNRSMSR